jgi:chromosome segregation ATPase
MSNTVDVNSALKEARAEIDAQLQYNSQQMGRLQGRKTGATQEQKDEINLKLDALTRKNIELREAWLESVAKIIDISALVAGFRVQTENMRREADVIGGVVTMLKVADSLLGITDGTIALINSAPRKT